MIKKKTKKNKKVKILKEKKQKKFIFGAKRGRPLKAKVHEDIFEEETPKVVIKKVFSNRVELLRNKENNIRLRYNDEYTGWFYKNPAVLKIVDKIYVAFSDSFKEFLPENMINVILEFRYYKGV